MELDAIIKQIDIFQGLTSQECTQILEAGKLRFIKKNTLIFSQGDDNYSIYIIKEGSVDVSLLTESGKELILLTLNPGEYFGELSLLDGSPISANITAVSDCVLFALHKNDFFTVLKDNNDLLRNVINHLCSKIRELTDKTESFALLDVYERFSLLLMDLSDETENGERVINTSLTHKNIALRIGSSREMVSRIIKDLENGGYISINHKVITIKKKLPLAW